MENKYPEERFVLLIVWCQISIIIIFLLYYPPYTHIALTTILTAVYPTSSPTIYLFCACPIF